jgi:hypothetical protein
MDIVEVVRVLPHRVDHNRRTSAKYRAWAEQQGLLEGPLPSAGEIQRRSPPRRPHSSP